jgi:hypothetical protein
MMGLLLHEHTPRPWSMAYGSHRLRAVVQVQFPWLLPLATGLMFGVAGVATCAPTSPATALLVTVIAGLPAGFGMATLWRWLSARLYPWLDAHPQSQSSIAAGYRLPPYPASETPSVVLGECHPERHYSQDGSYSMTYSTEEHFSATPEWATLPAQSLVTGLLVLGSIGSGKTAFVLRPAIFRLFHHPSQPGGLVMDSKAALVEPLQAEMASTNRLADLLPVGPKSPVRWNPLHMPLSSPATIAEALMTTIENINGSPYNADSRWIRNGSSHLAEGIIGLMRLRTGYVTALTLRMLLGELIARTQGTDEPGKSAQALIDALFAGHSAPTDHQAEFEHYAGLIVARMSEDEKFRAIYVSELLSLLVPLTAPDVLHLYNAPEDELDMPSWPEAINRGLVVVLDCNSKEQPGLAVILGMLLKLGYEQAMLARLAWSRAGVCNADRYMALLIDEYQDYASPGDSDYLALCRESRSITVFLTQGHASIVQRIGEERTKVILQSMRNRLVLNQSVPDFAADLLGQQEVDEVDRSIQEQMQDAALQATGRFAGQSSVSESLSVRRQRKHVVPPEVLSALPLGQGILQSHDGMRSVPLHRVFLRPYFAPDTRYSDLEMGD